MFLAQELLFQLTSKWKMPIFSKLLKSELITEFFWLSRSCWTFWREKAQNWVKFEKNDVFGSGIAISAHYEVKNANFLKIAPILTKTEFFLIQQVVLNILMRKSAKFG